MKRRIIALTAAIMMTFSAYSMIVASADEAVITHEKADILAASASTPDVPVDAGSDTIFPDSIESSGLNFVVYGDAYLDYVVEKGSIVITNVGGHGNLLKFPKFINKKPIYAVDSNAFNQSLFKTVDLNETRHIRRHAFSKSGSIKKVIALPLDVEEFAFAESTNLEEVEIGTTSIPSDCFVNCKNLKRVKANPFEIGSHAFKGCSSLEETPSLIGTERVGIGAFEDCTSLKEIEFSSFIENIGTGAFSGCKNLEKVTIPKSAKTFGLTPFSNCPKLTIYCYSGSAAEDMAKLFEYNYVLLDEEGKNNDESKDNGDNKNNGDNNNIKSPSTGIDYIYPTLILGFCALGIVGTVVSTKKKEE